MITYFSTYRGDEIHCVHVSELVNFEMINR